MQLRRLWQLSKQAMQRHTSSSWSCSLPWMRPASRLQSRQVQLLSWQQPCKTYRGSSRSTQRPGSSHRSAESKQQSLQEGRQPQRRLSG